MSTQAAEVKKAVTHATCVAVELENKDLSETIVQCHIDDRVPNVLARMDDGSEMPYEGCSLILTVQPSDKPGYTARFIPDESVDDLALYYND